MRPAWWTAAILVLAGCSGPAAPVPGGDGPGSDVVTGPHDGAISGIVVTEAIVPIADAWVHLVAGDETRTDDEGAFLFEDLEPGLYTLRVQAAGHMTIQASTEVVAGKVAKPRIVLPVDTNPQPYHHTTAFDGYIELADAWVTWILMDVTGNTQSCTCEFAFPVGTAARELVLEGFWEPSNPVNDAEFWWEVHGTDGAYEKGDYSTSPIWHRQRVDWEEGSGLIRFAVGTTIQFQQDYQAFATVFYNGPAPEGWSIAS